MSRFHRFVCNSYWVAYWTAFKTPRYRIVATEVSTAREVLSRAGVGGKRCVVCRGADVAAACVCRWRRRRAGRPAPFHRRAARPPRPAHSAHSAHPAHSAHSAHAAQWVHHAGPLHAAWPVASKLSFILFYTACDIFIECWYLSYELHVLCLIIFVSNQTSSCIWQPYYVRLIN